MIPLHDNVPTLRFAYVTYVLIALNAVVFIYELTLGPQALAQFFMQWGYVPARVVDTVQTGTFAPSVLITLVTSIFMHGGWFHFLGNMLFLHIFGNNVEDSMGRFRFVVFYLLIGVVANLAQVAVAPDSTVPGIGASGAIAGVLGAYLVLYPRARVLVLIPLLFFFPIIMLPAFVVLILWFVLQFFQGTFALAAGVAGEGGVAFWVHVAGFVAGAGLIFVFRNRKLCTTKCTWV
jgi:membrane associated rhomboid family serine protease